MVTVGVGLATAVRAIDDATLNIDRVVGAGWTASDLAVTLGFPTENARVGATIGRLQLTESKQTLNNVRIECPQLKLAGDLIACDQAKVFADWPALGKQALTAKLKYGRRDGSLDIAIDGLRIGAGRVALQGSLREAGWNAKLDLKQVPIEQVMKLAQDFKVPVPPLSATGTIDLSVTARGAQTNLRYAKIDGRIHELTANNEAGSLATDKLSVQLQATVQGSPKEWRFDAALQSSQGQAFAQPIFLDLGAHAMSMQAKGSLRNGSTLTLDNFVVDHRGVTQASGRGQLQLDQEQPVRSLELQLSSLQFPGAYESYFQPLLLDTGFKALQTAGNISGAMSIEDGEPQRIDLKFADVTVDDGAGTINLSALRGQWHWLADVDRDDDENAPASASVEVAPSKLQWNDGALFGLDLGASELNFRTQGRQFRLLQPTRIPLLDGSIDLDTLRVRNVGTPSVAFLVDATIKPISVSKLCQAFGWPEFGGTIGGAISKLRMREGVVTLGTTLHAQVFDGSVTISDLRLEQPFSQWPKFYSSIALENLDLELVTGAFSFGKITGRLSGAVNGLELFNWTPVAFDARLYTPPNDKTRHRISQRAVQNIGSVGGGGGGVTAALSGGVMRFFDDFNYDRLGWSCRLQNEICLMDGVAPAPNGNYYLVKGKGLPRIDVIGSSRRVDWPRLVRQLIEVTKSEGPVVQ